MLIMQQKGAPLFSVCFSSSFFLLLLILTTTSNHTSISHSHTHTFTFSLSLSHKAMATQAPNPSDVSNLPKDQQLNVHEENVLVDLDVSTRPVVPPHLLARLSQHDSPDL